MCVLGVEGSEKKSGPPRIISGTALTVGTGVQTFAIRTFFFFCEFMSKKWEYRFGENVLKAPTM